MEKGKKKRIPQKRVRRGREKGQKEVSAKQICDFEKVFSGRILRHGGRRIGRLHKGEKGVRALICWRKSFCNGRMALP